VVIVAKNSPPVTRYFYVGPDKDKIWLSRPVRTLPPTRLARLLPAVVDQPSPAAGGAGGGRPGRRAFSWRAAGKGANIYNKKPVKSH
jgi:hypothetical protein